MIPPERSHDDPVQPHRRLERRDWRWTRTVPSRWPLTRFGRALFVGPRGDVGGVLADAHGTADALGVVETTITAGHSTPLHVHRNEDEAFYVLAGAIDFVCGDDRFRAETGAFAYLPRDVPHGFVGVADVSRVLVFVVPAGLEAAFAEPARFAEIMAARGVEVVGPSPR
jgi:quercetin dioxygenase-like cupin family protein